MEKVAELETKNAALVAENQRLAEALVLREAQDIVLAEVAKETTLPEITRTRLVESLKTQTPLKEGKLDSEALKATIAQRVKDEKAYVEALKPQKITGLGAPADDTAAGKQRLFESMKAMHIANHKSPADAERLAKISAGL
jgi:hypothetical protein